jgi:hypothetical protein
MSTSKRSPLSAISDAREAKIQVGIAKDSDNPELTEEDFARARPWEVFPELYSSSKKSKGGRPK